MDDLDLEIVRWMYPGGVWSPWGVDPRITTADIAPHVGLSRTAVWARLREWRRDGFWAGLSVAPNVGLFGADLLRAEIRVADPAEGAALLDDLELVDGILGANLSFGDSAVASDAETVVFRLVGDGAANLRRRMRILKRLAPNGAVGGPWVDRPPSCRRPLTPLDWRILSAIFLHPNETRTQIARRVGVTLKTAVRKHSALIDDRAVFYAASLNWARHPSILVYLFCQGPRQLERVRAELNRLFPRHLLLNRAGVGFMGTKFESPNYLAARVPVRSPSEVQSLAVELSKIPGVTEVRTEVWGPFRRYPRWFTERLAERTSDAWPVSSSR